MTYFHMGKPHTIIGAIWFHFRVRDGIGWYPDAVVAGRTGCRCCLVYRWPVVAAQLDKQPQRIGENEVVALARVHNNRFYIAHNRSIQYSAKRLLGCYMVKPHGQLVQVSFTHYCASTPCLSTLWSSRALQESQGFSENSSWEGLPA